MTAEAESRQRVLAGRGESSRVLQIGMSEASVLLRKIESFSDPRLYALSLVAEQLSQSKQPLVPERVFVAGGGSGVGDSSASASQGMLGMLINLLVAEKSGFHLTETSQQGESLRELADRLTKEATASLEGESEPEALPDERAEVLSTAASIPNGKPEGTPIA